MPTVPLRTDLSIGWQHRKNSGNSCLRRRFLRPEGVKINKKFGAPSAPQMVLKLPQNHEDSEYVLSFEIREREGGLYSERTDRHTKSQTYPVPY